MAEITDPLDDRRLRPVPGRLAPAADELAVLSLFAVRADDGHWAVATGSLLSVPLEVALISWRAWRARQPQTRDGPARQGSISARFSTCGHSPISARSDESSGQPNGRPPSRESARAGSMP